MQLVFQINQELLHEVDHIILRMEEIGYEQVSEVVVDLSTFTTPNSSFLSQLLRLHLYLEPKGIPLKIANMSSTTERVLTHARLDRVIEINSTS